MIKSRNDCLYYLYFIEIAGMDLEQSNNFLALGLRYPIKFIIMAYLSPQIEVLAKKKMKQVGKSLIKKERSCGIFQDYGKVDLDTGNDRLLHLK